MATTERYVMDFRHVDGVAKKKKQKKIRRKTAQKKPNAPIASTYQEAHPHSQEFAGKKKKSNNGD